MNKYQINDMSGLRVTISHSRAGGNPGETTMNRFGSQRKTVGLENVLPIVILAEAGIQCN